MGAKGSLLALLKKLYDKRDAQKKWPTAKSAIAEIG
jgi:hypothetical protein